MRERLFILFALCCSFLAGVSQTSSSDTSAQFRESVFVSTDKPRYIAGEMLWWKAYYVNANTRRPENFSKVLYIELINDSLRPILRAKANLDALGSDGAFFLPGSLPSGEYHLRAYTRLIKISDRKQIFNRRIDIINANRPRIISAVAAQDQPDRASSQSEAHRMSLRVTSDAAEYGVRKPIRLQIQSVPATNLSIVVRPLDSDLTDTAQWLRTYLWTEPGPVAIDSQKDQIDRLPEIDGHIISGRILGDFNKPIPDMQVSVGIPNSRSDFRVTKTDDAGRFWFDMRHYYGPGKIYVSALYPQVENYRILIDDPFDSLPSISPTKGSTKAVALDNTEEKQAIGIQVQNLFWSQQLEKNYTPRYDTTAFFGKDFATYLLDDYVRFPSMQEVLTEYIPEVNVRRKTGTPEFHVLDVPNKIFFGLYPLILLDGIPVSAKQVLDYDPFKIRSIKVVTSNYILGSFSYGGIVLINTYNQDAADLKTDPRTMVMDYDGLQKKPEFFSPQYASTNEIRNRKPDFRSVLYWNPNATTDAKGEGKYEFYSGDLKGRYLILVEGMDQQGNAGAATQVIEVR